MEEEKPKGGAGRGGRGGGHAIGGGHAMGIGSKLSNEVMEASVEYPEDSEEGGEQTETVDHEDGGEGGGVEGGVVIGV